MDERRLVELYNQAQDAALAWRARVEARAALEQAEELRRALEELGKRLGE